MEPFTRSDLILEREAFETAKVREHVRIVVEKIYYVVRKQAIETNIYVYFHTIPDGMFKDVQGVAEAIRDELFTLFPDFGVNIQVVNDIYGSRRRQIVINWS